MKIQEFFDSKKRESARLVSELDAHVATWPEEKKRFDAIDVQCIALASRWNNARAAGSPTVFELEAELIKLRRQRDSIKYQHQIKRDSLHQKIEVFSRPVITDAAEELLDSMKKLSGLYSFERVEPARDIMGRRVRETVLVRHNGEALDKCRARIMELRKNLMEMMHCSLADIEDFIAAAKKEIAHFPLNTLEILEISETQAADMRPQPETTDLDKGTMIVPGVLHVHPRLDKNRVQGLANKVSFLEKTI